MRCALCSSVFKCLHILRRLSRRLSLILQKPEIMKTVFLSYIISTWEETDETAL